ncbi:hypothetical protein CI1B_11570 [Bradyrhizobium ivorense]|uniref:Uncharacterized protein n=1 Tax=Bradyrhizobium ivorense TaxID=2511166 RepID=A0A508ST21_9BRAD|nr:hypothetical protein CI1B_11570 [Bradyrhizobium ivorense]
MQRVDRGIEIAVLLLQTRKLGVEFALILVVHGCKLTDKHDKVVADEAAAAWRNIVLGHAPRKLDWFRSHDWLQISRKICMWHFASPIDSPAHLCTLHRPDRT